MCNMQNLTDIGSYVFGQLQTLSVLHMRNNPLLNYIDPYAFYNTRDNSTIKLKEVSYI